MPPPRSRESSTTRSRSRGDSSSGRGSADVLQVSRNISFERGGDDVRRSESACGSDLSHRKAVPARPPKSKNRGDSTRSQCRNGTHKRTEFKDRSGESRSDYDTDGPTRSRKLHSGDPKLGGSSDGDQSRGPRSSSRDSTSSKRDKLTSTVPKRQEPLEKDYQFDYDMFPPLEGIALPAYDEEGYLSDNGRKPRPKSLPKRYKKDRSADTLEPSATALVSSHERRSSEDQIAGSKTVAKSAELKEPDYHPKEYAAQLCGSPGEGPKVKRKPIKNGAQSRGASSRHTEPKLNRHRSGNGNNLSKNFSFEPIRQPPGEEQTGDERSDGMWHRFGGNDRTRNPSPQANTNRGSADEKAFHGINEEWFRKKSRPASTSKGLVNEQESKPDRYYAKNKINPSPPSDKGRNPLQHSERYTPEKDPFAGYDAPPEKIKEKKEKSPLRKFRKIFGGSRSDN